MNYQEFEDRGYVVAPSLFSEETCTDLLQYIIASFHRTKSDYIIEPNSRVHSPLELTSLTQDAVTQAVEPNYNTLETFLSGSQRLVELSSITVFPYAKAQRIHPDEQNLGKHLISVFINLAPTTKASGALRIIPGSHKDPDRNFRSVASEVLELPLGSAVYMNSKTWHGGGANQTSDRIRPVFYFSFGEPGLDGPTYSILPDVANLNKSLSDFKKQGPRKVTAWSVDSRPTLPYGASVVTPLDVSQGSSLLLISQQRVLKQVKLSPETPWIKQIISMVVEAPGQYSLSDIQHQVGIDMDWLINFFSYYSQEGWFSLVST